MPEYVTGLKELDRALNELPNSVAKRVLERGLKDAGKPILKTAKSKAINFHNPGIYTTGQLSKSLKLGTVLRRGRKKISSRRLNPGTGTVYLGPSWPMGAHAHFKEFGTSKQQAEPFLRPAWDQHKGEFLRTMGKFVWASLQKEARNQANRAARFIRKAA